jgi:hypothetical protein
LPRCWCRRIVGPERNHPQFVACSDKGLASWADLAIFASMAKARVIFKMKRIAEDDWQIEAHYPGAEIRYIKGLKSKIEVDEWLQETRRIDWLRSQGYAK